MFAHNFGELAHSPADSQCPYSPVCIGNNTSNQVLSVTGFLWFSISHKINLKEKKLIKIKHKTIMKRCPKKNY